MFSRRLSPFFLLLPLVSAAPVFTSAARAQTFNFLDDEAEKEGYDVSAQITSAPAEFALSRMENGDGYNLKVAPKSLQLFVTRNKKTKLLAQSPLATKFPANFVAQRRGPRWRFLFNGQTALEAEDDAFLEGQIGTRGAVRDARVQPIEPIKFDDDFMRVASEVAMKDALQNPRAGVKINGLQLTESIWTVASGRFATTGLTENTEAQVAQSANPFAFRPMDLGANLALSGRAFWSDYSAQASIQPQGASEIGLLVYAQDTKNYLGMFWGEKSGPQLRAVVNGQAKILDSAPNFGPFEAHQWNRLRLDVAGGALRGFIDDAEVLRARTGLFGRGQVGLWAKLARPGDEKKSEGALFDDAEVRSISDFSDDFGKIVPGRWTTIAGQWNLTGAASPTDARGAYAVMGEGDWTGYRALGDLRVPRDGAAGLLLHHIAGKGAYWLRVTGSKAKSPGAGRAQILLIQSGKTKILGETNLAIRADNSNLRWSFDDENGYLSAKMGDELIVDAFDVSLPRGRAGITAQNGASAASGENQAQIDEFAVEFPENSSKWAKVPELYEVESQAQTMGGWSTPQGFWVARPGDAKSAGTAPQDATPSNAVWHKGEFFGEEDVNFVLPDLSGDKTMQLIFAGKNGVKLTLVLSQKEGLNAALSNGKRTWNGAAKIATGAKLEIMRRGTFFIVRSGETVLLSARI
ncbi:hypothetical protein B1R32_103140 [Abditibacterium utsteinense]|uniref:Concanavalin A-like lectin/glucanases superfamily protein n=1 Tax=Abditibacterium utsteinense TaxID=1960156 RepID=A0A2S8SVR6_9BACT|nr:hypothetical protein [Abditibacterium utsteinense]PQV64873.1 hypothetical protein B1R32_103140 [Abditibacterium utsteinense]